MDLSQSITPKSDQLNAEDLLSGPVTVTITEVRAGSAEQPVEIHLAEFPGRPFKPSKTVRRVLVAAWGVEASAYTGRRMTLYRDPTVKWAGEAIGGIRVSHLSDIPKPLSIALTVTRGQRAMTVVKPLTEPARPAVARPTPEQMRAIGEAFTAASILDGDDKARFIAETIGRPMKGWGDLSAEDATAVLGALAELTAAPDGAA